MNKLFWIAVSWLLVAAIAGIGYHFGYQAAESAYNQRLAEQNQLAAQHIDAAAQAFMAQQQQANRTAAELEQVKAKLTSTAKTLQQRNQANAKANPVNAACRLSDYDISLYNDAIAFDRLPMLLAAVPSQLTAPPSTTDLIANHIDNSLRCTAIEAQLNQLITVIEQQQNNKENP